MPKTDTKSLCTSAKSHSHGALASHSQRSMSELSRRQEVRQKLNFGAKRGKTPYQNLGTGTENSSCSKNLLVFSHPLIRLLASAKDLSLSGWCVSLYASMACVVSSRAMVSNSLTVAARRRVKARKTARLISATSAFSTAVSCVLA